jgi:uncharacterized protein
MNATFVFPLTEVKEHGEQTVHAEVPSLLFAGTMSEGELIGNVMLDGVIRAADDVALFDGSAKGQWRFECTRCLKPVEGAWNERIEAEAPIDGGPMDLTEDVRQAVGLTQPMKVLCKPDCKGLCPTCQKDRNTTDCGHAAALPDDTRAMKGVSPRLTLRPKKG